METEVLTTEENAFDELDFDESVELRALVRSLKRARNFTLLFARCNQRLRQRELIEQIKNELPDKNIEVVYFENEISHFLDELKERLEGKTADAVFVYGLENSLGSLATSDKTRFVLSLNVSRNNFPQVVNCPIVFWLPDYGIKAFANRAPDFFSVRSGVYFFEKKDEAVNQIENFTSGDYYESASLSFDERQERISHVQQLINEYELLPLNEQNSATKNQLKFKLAELFYIGAEYDKAIEIIKSLIANARDKNDLNLEANLLNDLAILYESVDKYDEAESLLKESLKIHENILGENHPNTSTNYNNLATLYGKLGINSKAEILFKKALQIRENVLGKYHLDTAAVYNNFGGFYKKQGKYETAEFLYKEALKIRENLLGKNHPRTANSYNNLAVLYKSQGRYEEAKLFYEEALRIFENVLGKNHPDTKLVEKNFEIFLEEVKNQK